MRQSLLIVLSLVASLPAAAKQLITFEPKAIVAQVTPGGKVVFLGLSREARSYQLRVTDYARLIVDDDRDGIVRFPVVDGVPPESFWLVVDLTNGASAIEAPPGARLRRKPLPPSALQARGNSRAARAVHSDQHVLFWLVRPGVGAWASMVDDGAARDTDATHDGRASLLLDEMQSVGVSPPAPSDIRHGDIFAVVVPDTLEIFDTRVIR